MALQVWLPLVSDLSNQGLANSTNFGTTTAFATSGKIGSKSLYSNAQKIATFTELANVTNFSFAYWIKIDSSIAIVSWADIIGLECVAGSSTTIIRDEFTSTVGCHQILMGKDSTVGSNTYTYCGTGAATTGAKDVWTHYVVIKNNTNTYVYTNGVLTNTLTNTSFENSPQKLTGKIYLGNTGSTAAQINDLRIYDHCLSPMEVKELAKGLVLHYPLNRQGWGQENLASQYVMPGGNNPGSTATSGRTNYYGDYGIIIPATENADTYFSIWYSEPLESGAVYTLSAEVSGLVGNSCYNFPLFAQNNTSMGIIKFDHNGLNTLTFTMNYTGTIATATINGKTYYRMFMDDNGRTIASGQGAIIIKNIKLEKGDKATPWCPNLSDTLATTMSLNSTTEYDCSGFGNNGTRFGALTWSSGTPKYSVNTEFAGNTSIYVQIPTITLDWSKVSFAAWGRWDAFNSWSRIFDFGNGANGADWDICLANHSTNANPGLGGRTGGGASWPDTRVTEVTLTAGQWYHFVETIEDTTCKLYVNGELKKTITLTNSPTVTTMNRNYLGLSNWSGNGPLKGGISDFRLYTTVLSADDVKSLYQNSAYIDSSGNVYGAIHEV